MKEIIFLKENLVYDENLTDEGLLVYIALRGKYYLKNVHSTIDWIHYDDLIWNLTGEDSHTKCYIQKMKLGIENLSELGEIKIISYKKDKMKIEFLDTYYFDMKNELINTIKIYTDEVYKIINSRLKQRDKILRYFIIKISTLVRNIFNNVCAVYGVKIKNDNYNNNCDIGYDSIEYCAAYFADISESSAIRYDKWLEENGLLCMLRSENGLTNCYSRLKDKNGLEEFFNIRESAYLKYLKSKNINS